MAPFLFAALICCSLVIQEKCFAQEDVLINDFNSLQNEFKTPSKEYGTIPFFILNDDVTKDEIERNMLELKNSGCGAVIFHPRPGMITEYLSPKWFELFNYAVEVGKKIEMNVWIYDENSYPSGFAGGHVPAQMPESFNEGQGLAPVDTNTLPSDYMKYFLIFKKDKDKYIDISSSAGKEDGIKGEYILFKKTFYEQTGWNGGFSYVDLLHKGVTQKFLEITIPGYKKVSGEEFGKTVQGVFTDEPEINSSGGIRWTTDLFETFQDQWGYSLKDNLPSLYKETGDWERIRHNYAQILLKLFTERWSVPVSEYYKKLGLKFTGHYWEHGWPDMRLGPDNMAMYAYHDLPAIDLLFNQFDEVSPNAQFGNIRAVKELASVANQFGRKRTLCETYGGAGWEITFQDLKRLGDWEYALGVNTLNQHLYFFSIAGARKYDYPPSFSYHNPWFKNYSYLNKYYARLSVALSSGKQINKMLVLEPTTTAWMYACYLRNLRNQKYFQIGETFQKFVTTLEKGQVEYDLGSEDILSKWGKNEGNTLKVGERIYSSIVIPPLMENLNKTTFGLIKKYVEAGGKLVAFSIPQRLDGAIDKQVSDFFKQNNSKIIHLEGFDPAVVSSNFQNNEIIFENLNGGDLFHLRKKTSDGQIVFLANSSLENNSSGSLTLEGKDALLLNAFSGVISDYKEEKAGDNLRINFNLKPAESILLFISNNKKKGYNSLVEHDVVPVESENKIIAIPEKENVLPIDFCDLYVNGQLTKQMYVYNAAQKVFIEHGFPDGNPWDQKVQYKTNTLDKDHFLTNSGFIATYHFTISEQFDYSKMEAVIERAELWHVKVNGQEIKNVKDKWWLDRAFAVYEIGKWVHKGENIITLACSPMSVHAEIQAIYILGKFSVEPADKGWIINSPKNSFSLGSWKDQSYPFYSWDVAYKKEFKIKKKSSYYEVGLGKWNGTVAEVTVNGKKAGIIALPTDKVDVTDFITPGKNLIQIKITGSLKNLLGPHYNNPAKGFVGFVSWRDVNELPSAKNYQLLDYGLTDDFYLYTQLDK
ncbi:MAG: glycosyl hydrolase [Bacteroidota bacterium]|nr:glycosyl hydrolase [Bacteroidota bacterium]